MKYYTFLIDWNSYKRTYENIQKFKTAERYVYTTGCLLDYNFFKKHYEIIATDLSKQKALDVNPKAI